MADHARRSPARARAARPALPREEPRGSLRSRPTTSRIPTSRPPFRNVHRRRRHGQSPRPGRGGAAAQARADWPLVAGVLGSERRRLRRPTRSRDASDLQAAHVPARRDPLGALRAGRPDDLLLGDLGRHAASDLLGTPGQPRVPLAGCPAATLRSISASGEMLVTHAGRRPAMLARLPIGSGAPRELVEGVRDADWAPNGEDLAVLRTVAAACDSSSRSARICIFRRVDSAT